MSSRLVVRPGIYHPDLSPVRTCVVQTFLRSGLVSFRSLEVQGSGRLGLLVDLLGL